jgi:hypothetical protein
MVIFEVNSIWNLHDGKVITISPCFGSPCLMTSLSASRFTWTTPPVYEALG